MRAWITGLLAAACGCAKVGVPSGGPVDTTAPKVVGFHPAPDATDVPLDARVEVLFSEPMDPERSAEAVFVAPATGVRTRWQGRRLRLEFGQGLQPRRTYVITVGTGARDQRGNPLQQSATLAFATGPQLDQGRVRGRVWRDDRPRAGAHVWAYDLEHLRGQVGTAPPDYRTQSGQDGAYEFLRLAAGTYRILAFGDGNRNGRWDAGEELGLPAADVRVEEGAEAAAGDLDLQPAGLPAPRLVRVQSLSPRRLLLQLDREVSADGAALAIEGLAVEGLYPSPQDRTRLYAVTAPQQAERSYALTAFEVEGRALRWSEPVRGSGRPDRTPPAVWRQYPQGGQELAPSDSLELVFTRSLAGAPPSDFWAATDSTLAPPGAWRWQGMTRLVFAPAGGWPDGVCRLRGRPELLRDPEGLALRDSVLSFSFRALAPSELGSVRGRVQGPGAAGAWVVARDPERPRPLQARAGEDGRFAFEGVCPGAYTISGYADLDGDGRHGPGRLSPYAPSEPYGRVPEPVAVARGGTTPDVELVFR